MNLDVTGAISRRDLGATERGNRLDANTQEPTSTSGQTDRTSTSGQTDRTSTSGQAAGRVRESASPPFRVRPIPDISPPVIDPRAPLSPDLSPFIQGTLAISFGGDYDAAADPEHRGYFGPQHTLSRDLPDPKAWVTHMAQALIEVMSGARPAPQVIRWTTPEVYSVVARRNAVSGRRTVVARPAVVRKVLICEPVDGIVEASAIVVDSGRVRALAMRLTGVDRRWVVSALQVG